jgi:hypothetical protein
MPKIETKLMDKAGFILLFAQQYRSNCEAQTHALA